MTLERNARIAGIAFLFYIAAGISSMWLGAGTAGSLLKAISPTSFAALVLGVTLYAITRDVDTDLALLALVCRLLEATPGDGTLYFAVGSTIFCWLMLRGRLVPVALAGFGVLVSVTLVLFIPLSRSGLFGGPWDWSSRITWFVWLPMLVFEVALALWLIIKGVSYERSHAQSCTRPRPGDR